MGQVSKSLTAKSPQPKKQKKNTFRIKRDDVVVVISGKHKGAKGRVLEVLPEKQRVRIEDVAIIKRHIPPQRNPRHPEGGIIEQAGTIHISNVMLWSEEHGRPVRTGSKFTDDKKIRVAKGREVKGSEV
jgi:large subunit ribosomal protein L24